MSNLLPEKNQKQLLYANRARILLASSYLMLGAAIFSACALLPGYIVLVSTRPKDAAQTAIMQSKTEEKDLKRAQNLLTQLSPAFSSTTPSQVILSVISEKPRNARVDHISYTAGRAGNLQISGSAATRDDINAFRDNLSKDSHFSKVSVPVGALIGAQGGQFTITLKGSF